VAWNIHAMLHSPHPVSPEDKCYYAGFIDDLGTRKAVILFGSITKWKEQIQLGFNMKKTKLRLPSTDILFFA
jgi:hypothetical protein